MVNRRGLGRGLGAESVTQLITAGFRMGRLTSSCVPSGLSSALYLSLVFKPSGEDVRPHQSQRTVGTGGRGGRGAGVLGLLVLEGRGLGWAISICTSWRVRAFVFAAPPSARDAESSLGLSLEGPRREPPERPVRCGCKSEAEGMRSVGLGMGPLGLALRSLRSRGC